MVKVMLINDMNRNSAGPEIDDADRHNAPQITRITIYALRMRRSYWYRRYQQKLIQRKEAYDAQRCRFAHMVPSR